MAEEQYGSLRRRRDRKNTETTARAEALRLLKNLKEGGRRSESGFNVKIEDPIYDTVDEDEYEALVSKRRAEAREFIVDDDGIGYGDLEEEEDWSRSGFCSGDESDPENERFKKKKKKNVEKKVTPCRKSSLLQAAAATMGKQRLPTMFTSSVFKKSNDDRSKVVLRNSIVDDVIAEFVPDDTDRERRRKGLVPSSSNSISSGFRNPNKDVERSHGSGICNNSVSKSEFPLVENAISNYQSCSTKMDESALKNVGVEEIKVKKELDPDVVDDLILKSEDLFTNECLVVANDNGKEKEEMAIPMAKRSNTSPVNDLIKEEKDSSMAATVACKDVKQEGNLCINIMEGETNLNSEEKSDFDLNFDGSLSFYILDAHEEISGGNAGNLYLFGKVKAGKKYYSCCLVVKNLQRCVYAIPTTSVFPSDDITKLEKDVEESHISSGDFRAKLQDLAFEMKNEVSQHLLNINVSTFSMTPVKRNYAFELSEIPLGENYVLKINYPFKDPTLPFDAKGKTFKALLGTNSSSLELFLIKRKIKGPSWLSISEFFSCPSQQRVSWCKFELIVDSSKNVQLSTSKTALEVPTVVVTSINLKTIIDDKRNVNEIVSASVVCCHKVKIDSPMMASEWANTLSHFTVVRKLEGVPFPAGFRSAVKNRNSTDKLNLVFEISERALLNRLTAELYKLDSDVLVGHNISGFDLDVLLNRIQSCGVPSSTWSKLGRLKRTLMPKISKGNAVYGSGASTGIMTCIAGRLLCDTYLSSRDLLKEVSYSLSQLARTQLNKERKELSPNDIPIMFQASDSLVELIDYGERDAWLSMELMFHLSILPLTRQLTNISGNLWGRTLQGGRAQRVEYLLLHAFHAKKYMVPDRAVSHWKANKLEKRKVNQTSHDRNSDVNNDDQVIENDDHIEHEKGKKGSSYAGGLVLEPKKGLYDKFVLLLDFNSLYPSIIQEYNICFTTVERSSDVKFTRLPSNMKPGVLPELLKNLVERRRMVKAWLRTASGLKAQQFDIQQQALKLTANSMYGCLGFSNSRFYAKPLAELITLQGREILQSTVDLVQKKLNLEVIYGDTDSIMIYSGLDDISKAKAVAGRVIQEVNKKYRCLEIDLDGLYKRMLLLKKKKYAAVKVQLKDGKAYDEVIERKGLDIVRRDWSLLSKEMGDFCLSKILSGMSCEDVVLQTHQSLIKVQEEMRNGQVAVDKYVITKTLTKPPEAYHDKNQPHVQVALRMKQSGHTSGCSAGDTVPYIICTKQQEPTTTSSSSLGISQRARHPDELKVADESEKWVIDIDYYLSQQIHPVVSRLCASIQGTSPAHIADCLGLDSSRFRHRAIYSREEDPSGSLICAVDDEDRYSGCQALNLTCPTCSNCYECPPMVTFLTNGPEKEKRNSWNKLHCPKCPDDIGSTYITSASILNQVKRQADGFISTYYKGLMKCDDETCKYTTRAVTLRLVGDSERGTLCPNYPHCNGHLQRQYPEADLYRQLSYFCHILDTTKCIEKRENIATRMQAEKEMSPIREIVGPAASAIQNLRERCAYMWVNLKELAISC